jgi:hypothetical protein
MKQCFNIVNSHDLYRQQLNKLSWVSFALPFCAVETRTVLGKLDL